MRHRLKDNQISHYQVNGSNFEMKKLSKIEGFIWISKGSQLLKHPVLLKLCIMAILICNKGPSEWPTDSWTDIATSRIAVISK